MNKFFTLFALITITLSVSLFFACDAGSMCCESLHSSTTECQTCTPHLEASFDAGNLHPEILLFPEIIGQIFFEVINIERVHVVFAPDRPPTFHA